MDRYSVLLYQESAVWVYPSPLPSSTTRPPPSYVHSYGKLSDGVREQDAAVEEAGQTQPLRRARQ